MEFKPEFKPVYAELDLGEYDERYRGERLTLLQNPTRRFRQDFFTSTVRMSSDEFLNAIALILDCPREGIADVVDNLDIEILHWLFVPHTGDGDKLIMPFIFNVWDRYVHERVKAFAGR